MAAAEAARAAGPPRVGAATPTDPGAHAATAADEAAEATTEAGTVGGLDGDAIVSVGRPVSRPRDSSNEKPARAGGAATDVKVNPVVSEGEVDGDAIVKVGRPASKPRDSSNEKAGRASGAVTDVTVDPVAHWVETP